MIEITAKQLYEDYILPHMTVHRAEIIAQTGEEFGFSTYLLNGKKIEDRLADQAILSDVDSVLDNIGATKNSFSRIRVSLAIAIYMNAVLHRSYNTQTTVHPANFNLIFIEPKDFSSTFPEIVDTVPPSESKEPQCQCDSNHLFAFGHQSGCTWKAWKSSR